MKNMEKQIGLLIDSLNRQYQAACRQTNVSAIERDIMLSTLREIYDSIRNSDSTPDNKAPEENTEQSLHVVQQEEVITRTTVAVAAEEPKDMLQPVMTQEPVIQEIIIEKTTVAQSFAGKTTLHDRMSTVKNDRSVAERLNEKPISDLRKIGINERYSFIRELFGGDQQQYQQSMDELNGFPAYEQARRHLYEELASRWKWDSENKALAELNELIRRRFHA